MSMLPYPVLCQSVDCSQPAVYKIAARWSDGLTSELKTYALSCPKCLAAWYRASQTKQAACRTSAGEVLAPPGIFHLRRGLHDQELQHAAEIEAQLQSAT